MSLFAKPRPAGQAWLYSLSGAAILFSFIARMVQREAVRPDYDDGVYWQTALAIGAGHQPYTEVFHAQPPLFPAIISSPFLLLPATRAGSLDAEIAARLLMIATAVLFAAAAGAIAHLLAGPRAGALAALIVALLPQVQRYCYQFGADLPATAFTAVGLLCALQARTNQQRRWWLAAGGALAVAMMTKLIVVLVVPSLLLAVFAGASGAGRIRRAATAASFMAAGFAASCLIILLVLRAPTVALQQIFSFHVHAAGEDQPAPSGAPSMIDMWIVPFTVLAGGGTVLSLLWSRAAQRTGLAAIALWEAMGLPFGLFYRPISEHQLLLFVLPGAVLTASGISLAWRRTDARRPRLAATGVAAAALICAAQAPSFAVSPPIGAHTIRACLHDLPDNYVLVTDDQELLARSGLRTPPWLADTSWVRLNAGYLPESTIIAEAERSDGMLLAPADRARLTSATLLQWAGQHFPVEYHADGYRLLLATPVHTGNCRAA